MTDGFPAFCLGFAVAVASAGLAAAQGAADENAAQLSQCDSDKAVLADLAARLSVQVDDTIAVCDARVAETRQAAADRLSLCEAEVTQNQRANITLNDRLTACEAAPKEDPEAPALRAALTEAQTAQRAAEAEVLRLTQRLATFGLGAAPSYSYAGGSVWSSFVKRGELSPVLGDLPRLTIEACPAALEWLESQTGAAKAAQRILWVWDGEDPLLCARNTDGTTGLTPPRNRSEAHVVVFR